MGESQEQIVHAGMYVSVHYNIQGRAATKDNVVEDWYACSCRYACSSDWDVGYACSIGTPVRASCRLYASSTQYKQFTQARGKPAHMLHRNVALLLGAVLVLMTILTAESGGTGKGSDLTSAGGRRSARSGGAELAAAAAADQTTDELLAQTLQDEENKKAAAAHNTSGCGCPSDAHLAEILQDEENKKTETKLPGTPAPKKQKVMPHLKPKASASAGASSVTYCIPHII